MKLTDKDRVELLWYVVGMYALAGIDDFADLKIYPKYAEGWEPDGIIMSDALDCDFKKDIYDNDSYFDFVKKNKDLYHIGDTLNQVVCDFTRDIRDNNLAIDLDMYNELRDKLVATFKEFLDKYNNRNQTEYEFVDSGFTLNDEIAYFKRRIK